MPDNFTSIAASIQQALYNHKLSQIREPKPEREPKPARALKPEREPKMPREPKSVREPKPPRQPKPPRVYTPPPARRYQQIPTVVQHPSPRALPPSEINKPVVQYDEWVIEQAKALWKRDHPGMTLKQARKLAQKGRMHEDPWAVYLNDPRIERRKFRQE